MLHLLNNEPTVWQTPGNNKWMKEEKLVVLDENTPEEEQHRKEEQNRNKINLLITYHQQGNKYIEMQDFLQIEYKTSSCC